VVTWYVVFEDLPDESPVSWWLGRILSKGHQHCYAFRDTAAGLLVVNQNCEYLEADCTPMLTAEAWAAYCLTERRLHVIRVDRELTGRRHVPRFGNCVSTIRSLLGLPAKPWQTPKRLHRQLARLESLTRVAAP
jgi:hypothetical protein